MAVTYGEACAWAVWMRAFTKSDLAVQMAVPPEALDGFIIGLIYNGTIEDTGISVNGRGPPEPLYTYVPLPPGPTEHPTFPPEWRITPGCYAGVLSPRGEPVRIRTERKMRKGRSTPGQRQKINLAEKRWKQQQETVAERNKRRQEKRQARMRKLSAKEVHAIEKRKRRLAKRKRNEETLNRMGGE